MAKKRNDEASQRRLQEVEKHEFIRNESDPSCEPSIGLNSGPLEVLEDIHFENLFTLEEIQRIQDEFADATGVASIITKTDGTPITQPSNFCRLCMDIIRKTEKGLANCLKSDGASCPPQALPAPELPELPASETWRLGQPG